jgi:hypothetical protein
MTCVLQEKRTRVCACARKVDEQRDRADAGWKRTAPGCITSKFLYVVGNALQQVALLVNSCIISKYIYVCDYNCGAQRLVRAVLQRPAVIF